MWYTVAGTVARHDGVWVEVDTEPGDRLRVSWGLCHSLPPIGTRIGITVEPVQRRGFILRSWRVM